MSVLAQIQVDRRTREMKREPSDPLVAGRSGASPTPAEGCEKTPRLRCERPPRKSAISRFAIAPAISNLFPTARTLQRTEHRHAQGRPPPGAGAPKGNMNGVKSGLYSTRVHFALAARPSTQTRHRREQPAAQDVHRRHPTSVVFRETPPLRAVGQGAGGVRYQSETNQKTGHSMSGRSNPKVLNRPRKDALATSNQTHLEPLPITHSPPPFPTPHPGPTTHHPRLLNCPLPRPFLYSIAALLRAALSARCPACGR